MNPTELPPFETTITTHRAVNHVLYRAPVGMIGLKRCGLDDLMYQVKALAPADLRLLADYVFGEDHAKAVEKARIYGAKAFHYREVLDQVAGALGLPSVCRLDTNGTPQCDGTKPLQLIARIEELTELERQRNDLNECLSTHADAAAGRAPIVEAIRLLELHKASPKPRPMACPVCRYWHVDGGRWATEQHHRKHQCQHCGHEWRHEHTNTVGVPPDSIAIPWPEDDPSTMRLVWVAKTPGGSAKTASTESVNRIDPVTAEGPQGRSSGGAAGPPGGIKDHFRDIAEKLLRDIAEHREWILKAFIAETGLHPTECEIWERVAEDGLGRVWSVRKRAPSVFESDPAIAVAMAANEWRRRFEDQVRSVAEHAAVRLENSKSETGARNTLFQALDAWETKLDAGSKDAMSRARVDRAAAMGVRLENSPGGSAGTGAGNHPGAAPSGAVLRKPAQPSGDSSPLTPSDATGKEKFADVWQLNEAALSLLSGGDRIPIELAYQWACEGAKYDLAEWAVLAPFLERRPRPANPHIGNPIDTDHWAATGEIRDLPIAHPAPTYSHALPGTLAEGWNLDARDAAANPAPTGELKAVRVVEWVCGCVDSSDPAQDYRCGKPPDRCSRTKAPVKLLEETIDALKEPLAQPAAAQGEPSGQRHAITEEGDCASWCNACRENRERGLNPDGTYDAFAGAKAERDYRRAAAAQPPAKGGPVKLAKGDRFVVSARSAAYAGRHGTVREPIDAQDALVKIDGDCAKIRMPVAWLHSPIAEPSAKEAAQGERELLPGLRKAADLLLGWREHHRAVGKNAAYLQAFDEAYVHVGAAAERVAAGEHPESTTPVAQPPVKAAAQGERCPACLGRRTIGYLDGGEPCELCRGTGIVQPLAKERCTCEPDGTGGRFSDACPLHGKPAAAQGERLECDRYRASGEVRCTITIAHREDGTPYFHHSSPGHQASNAQPPAKERGDPCDHTGELAIDRATGEETCQDCGEQPKKGRGEAGEEARVAGILESAKQNTKAMREAEVAGELVLENAASHEAIRTLVGLNGMAPNQGPQSPLDWAPLRCQVTRNPYGTDTLAIGAQCPCDCCRASRRIAEIEAKASECRTEKSKAESWELSAKGLERDLARALEDRDGARSSNTTLAEQRDGLVRALDVVNGKLATVAADALEAVEAVKEANRLKREGK